MTWGEFKRKVEANYVKDEDQLAYIDVGHSFEFEVNRREDGRIAID